MLIAKDSLGDSFLEVLSLSTPPFWRRNPRVSRLDLFRKKKRFGAPETWKILRAFQTVQPANGTSKAGAEQTSGLTSDTASLGFPGWLGGFFSGVFLRPRTFGFSRLWCLVLFVVSPCFLFSFLPLSLGLYFSCFSPAFSGVRRAPWVFKGLKGRAHATFLRRGRLRGQRDGLRGLGGPAPAERRAHAPRFRFVASALIFGSKEMSRSSRSARQWGGISRQETPGNSTSFPGKLGPPDRCQLLTSFGFPYENRLQKKLVALF